MWFKNTPVELDYFESGRFRFVNTRDLAARPEAVFAVLADSEQWARWFSDFREVHWLTPPPHGVGSERHVVLKTLQAKERFLAWEPGKRMAFMITEATLPLTNAMAEDYALEALPEGGTRFTWTVVYTPKPLARVIHPVLRLVFARMFRKAADGLQRYLAGH